MFKAAALTLALLSVASSAVAADKIRVFTQDGPVAGIAADGYVSYKGIPYAAPPVGPLRWQKPQPPAKWAADFDASQFGASCFQAEPPSHVVPGSPALQMSEDCLKLNVWTPAGAAKGGKLPVMVWIHGGGNVGGSPADFFMDGQNFARDGVIVVSMSYRLGILGFFSYPGEKAANFGLWDQVAALRWVKANVAAFGGDPDNVTVFGESAGGEDIIALLTAPAARGLFAKAIIESGGGGWGPAADIADQQKTIGSRFAGQSLDALRKLPAADLVKANGDLADPVVDHDLLPESPLAAFADGHAATVPIIIGTNNEEGSLLGPGTHNPASVWEHSLNAADLTTIRAAYGDTAKDDTAFAEMLFRDGYFTGPSRFIARHANAWLYRFSYVLAPLQARRSGAWHGSEVPFVFERWPIDDLNADDHRVEQAIHGDWIAFAKTGNPGWTTLKASSQEMRFDAHPSMQAPADQPALDRLDAKLSPLH